MADQPTRRLTDPPSDAEAHRCPKCGGPQIHTQAGGYVILVRDPNFLGIGRSTGCDAWVCRQCAYVEWFARNLENLGSPD